MKRLKIVDSEGFSIEVDDNWGGIEDAKKNLEKNQDEDVIFIAINDPVLEIQECVALTIEKGKQLIEGLQSLIKELEK